MGISGIGAIPYVIASHARGGRPLQRMKPPWVMGVRSQLGSRAIGAEKTAQPVKIFFKSVKNGKSQQ